MITDRWIGNAAAKVQIMVDLILRVYHENEFKDLTDFRGGFNL
ncbi:hypothetical protein HMPREF9103_00562 [Lentilactobacillus parafarraginis F0439]|uniref:Uncharacterized protein n=1 Tax=Lentilactobacillus parafarraginis F0439 TaxID=797515 RepID=G9ZLG4_9LACO|nr:hypothetical protein HMPREF9103_00562 [Lentilactobacillus parafarraginis F0439]